ncbi:hypothetical protein DMENIID0001_144740 [Sergentomyia squamirostris]
MNQGLIDFWAVLQATPTWSLLQGGQTGMSGEDSPCSQQLVWYTLEDSADSDEDVPRKKYETVFVNNESEDEFSDKGSEIMAEYTSSEDEAEKKKEGADAAIAEPGGGGDQLMFEDMQEVAGGGDQLMFEEMQEV